MQTKRNAICSTYRFYVRTSHMWKTKQRRREYNNFQKKKEKKNVLIKMCTENKFIRVCHKHGMQTHAQTDEKKKQQHMISLMCLFVRGTYHTRQWKLYNDERRAVYEWNRRKITLRRLEITNYILWRDLLSLLRCHIITMHCVPFHLVCPPYYMPLCMFYGNRMCYVACMCVVHHR